MKTTIFITIVFTLLLTGCFENKSMSKNECIKSGLVFKSIKKFNHRFGKYEVTSVCQKS